MNNSHFAGYSQIHIAHGIICRNNTQRTEYELWETHNQMWGSRCDGLDSDLRPNGDQEDSFDAWFLMSTRGGNGCCTANRFGGQEMPGGIQYHLNGIDLAFVDFLIYR